MTNKNFVQIFLRPMFTLLVSAGAVCAQTAVPMTSAQVMAIDGQGQTEAPAATVKQKAAKSSRPDGRSATPPPDAMVVTPGLTAKDAETSKRESNGPQTQSPAVGNDAAELAKKLSNPVAALISLPLQSNFDSGMGTGSGWRHTLNVQPVIPVALSPEWNMISRTIIPLIHQRNVTGPGVTQNGLGDITQSLFFSPNKSEPFVWAVGPVFLIPTATNAKLGSQKFGVGPTALVLKQSHGWTYLILMNHIWSVVGNSSRAKVNSTFLQPSISYSTKDGWTYGLNTESSYDWTNHAWSIPIIPSVSRLVRFGMQPVSFGGGVKCWVTTPGGGPEGCSLRVVVTALFPKR
jgi:hypothetical protein